MSNKYRAIQGSLPRQWDVARWTEDHFRQFFQLVIDLTQFSDQGQAVIKCTPETIKHLEDSILNGKPSYATELLYRINQFTTDPSATPRKFFYRLTALIRAVGNYVKKHPAVVTTELKGMIIDNPRLNWMLSSYVTHTTKVGAPVTVPDSRDTTTFQTRPAARVEDPQTKLLNSMVILADVFETLAGSLTKKELRSLKASEKIGAISKLSFLFGNRIKPNAQTFKQINIYKASAQDLEQSLLDYGSET